MQALGARNQPLGQPRAIGSKAFPRAYFEIIAIDPSAPHGRSEGAASPSEGRREAPSGPGDAPHRTRWFDLDSFRGPPRLTNWICRTDDLDAALAAAPPDTGTATDLSRGDYRWRFAIPATGKLPFNDCHPALIQWQGELHPAKSLRDHGIRLTGLQITHPDAPALQAALKRLTDPRVTIARGPYHALRATFATPNGIRVLT